MITGPDIEQILLPPDPGAATLLIVAGYGSPAMANRHFAMLQEYGRDDISIRLILGMPVQDGLADSAHRGFHQLEGSAGGRFRCRYVSTRPPVHAKVYLWQDADDQPIRAYIGSANYSQTALLPGGTSEAILVAADPSKALTFIEEIEARSISCTDPNVTNLIQIHPDLPRTRRNIPAAPVLVPAPAPALQSVTLSLLAGTGEIHDRAGLNWGQRPGRDQNQAYIPVPRAVTNTGFFPPRGSHFTLVTDDGKVMDCAVAQDGGKAIESTQSNAILGAYFRDRIGLPSGAYVQKADLERYGRTDVTITRIDAETYYMDFST